MSALHHAVAVAVIACMLAAAAPAGAQTPPEFGLFVIGGPFGGELLDEKHPSTKVEWIKVTCPVGTEFHVKSAAIWVFEDVGSRRRAVGLWSLWVYLTSAGGVMKFPLLLDGSGLGHKVLTLPAPVRFGGAVEVATARVGSGRFSVVLGGVCMAPVTVTTATR